MYKDNAQWIPERDKKLIPLEEALMQVFHSWDEFKIPQKLMIYLLPSQQQQTHR